MQAAFLLDTDDAFLSENAPKRWKLNSYMKAKSFLTENLQTLSYLPRSTTKNCAPLQGYSLNKCKSYLNHWIFVCGMDSKM